MANSEIPEFVQNMLQRGEEERKPYVEMLKRSVAEWNQWRDDNPTIRPRLDMADLQGMDLRGVNFSQMNLVSANLSGADLRGADLSGPDLSKSETLIGRTRSNLEEVNFSGANLSGANLSWAHLAVANMSDAKLHKAKLIGTNLRITNLSRAIFSEAHLDRADLSGANLNEADLSGATLSGAVINEQTNYKNAKGCTIGVNGFYVSKTDSHGFRTESAALMTLTPPGDSMKGANATAVIESLKQARSLHIFSMTLAAFVFYLAILQPEKINLPLINASVSPGDFGLFAMPLSIAFLALVASFMSDALSGARYLQTREDAMTVGQFPWALSKYPDSDWKHKGLSWLARLIMAFHPMVFIYFVRSGQWPSSIWLFVGFIVALLLLSIWIIDISQQFQRPILFDKKTEEARKAEKEILDKLVKALNNNTQELTKWTEQFQPKNAPTSDAEDSEE